MQRERLLHFFYLLKHDATCVIQRIQGKPRVHLLHIGKTGGSSIKAAIRRHSAPSGPYVICLHPHDVRLRDVPNRESVIFFLRDPISRFISGFYSRQRQGQPTYFSPWSPGERIAFEHFHTPNSLAMALSAQDTQEKERAEAAMRSIEHVRSSYWEWFENEEYFRSRLTDILFIGFQECLAADFERLKTRLGLPNSAALPENDIQAHRNPRTLDRDLEDRAIANLNRWYREDFSFISLCKSIVRENLAPDGSASAVRQRALSDEGCGPSMS